MRGGLISVTMPRMVVESTRGCPGCMRERSGAVAVTRGERLTILTGWVGQFMDGVVLYWS